MEACQISDMPRLNQADRKAVCHRTTGGVQREDSPTGGPIDRQTRASAFDMLVREEYLKPMLKTLVAKQKKR